MWKGPRRRPRLGRRQRIHDPSRAKPDVGRPVSGAAPALKGSGRDVVARGDIAFGEIRLCHGTLSRGRPSSRLFLSRHGFEPLDSSPAGLYGRGGGFALDLAIKPGPSALQRGGAISPPISADRKPPQGPLVTVLPEWQHDRGPSDDSSLLPWLHMAINVVWIGVSLAGAGGLALCNDLRGCRTSIRLWLPPPCAFSPSKGRYWAQPR